LRNGGVLVEVRRGDGPKLIGCVALREHGLVASSFTRRNPRIMVREVEEDIGVNELIDRMCATNPFITSKDEIRGVRQLRRRNDRTAHILEVPPTVRGRLVGDGRVSLGWRSYPVSVYLNVRQCYRCLALGHLAAACEVQASWPTCCRCAGSHEMGRC